MGEKVTLVFTVPPLEKKDEDSLKGLIEKLGVKENQVLVVEDSLPSDIRPAVNIGISKANIFRVSTDYGASNAGGEVEGVVKIQDFDQLSEVIVENF